MLGFVRFGVLGLFCFVTFYYKGRFDDSKLGQPQARAATRYARKAPDARRAPGAEPRTTNTCRSTCKYYYSIYAFASECDEVYNQ